jgi:hypothetical protein
MTEQQVVFDQQRQLDLIREGLQQGEQVIAVYDAIGAGTGFIGMTDKRIVIQDNSYFGKQIALTSVPYRLITSVSFVSDKSILGKFFSSSKIAITARWEDLRGGVPRDREGQARPRPRPVEDSAVIAGGTRPRPLARQITSR